MKQILAVIIIAGSFASAGSAQDAMTCADFSAMDSAGQMAAVEGMGNMGAEDTESEERMTKALAACEAHPEMTLSEAMETMGE